MAKETEDRLDELHSILARSEQEDFELPNQCLYVSCEVKLPLGVRYCPAHKNQCLWTDEYDVQCEVRLPKGKHRCLVHQRLVDKLKKKGSGKGTGVQKGREGNSGRVSYKPLSE